MMRKQGNRCRRRGMTTMEFAMILPFIIALILGVVEFGTMFYSWMTIQKAAQSAARFASTGEGEEEGTRETQTIQVAEEWMITLDKGTKEITISSWPTPVASGDGATGSAGGPCGLVQVAVVYNYHPFTPVVGDILPEVVPLYGQDRKLNEPWKPCDN